MLTLITVSICLFVIILTGWTLTTYFFKKDSQKLIKAELKNLLNIYKTFFVSLKSLMRVLTSSSLSSEESEVNTNKEPVLKKVKQPLNLVEPVQEIEAPLLEVAYEEDIDTALSSFSPEVIEVINEEEEKVA